MAGTPSVVWTQKNKMKWKLNLQYKQVLNVKGTKRGYRHIPLIPLSSLPPCLSLSVYLSETHGLSVSLSLSLIVTTLSYCYYCYYCYHCYYCCCYYYYYYYCFYCNYYYDYCY